MLQLRIQELTVADALATCDMVRLELLRAVRDDTEFVQIDQRLDAARLLPTDAPVWAEAIDFGLRLRRAGVSIGTPDLLIACVAIVHQAVILHNDQAFEQMRQHSSLLTEPISHLL